MTEAPPASDEDIARYEQLIADHDGNWDFTSETVRRLIARIRTDGVFATARAKQDYHAGIEAVAKVACEDCRNSIPFATSSEHHVDLGYWRKCKSVTIRALAAKSASEQ